VTSRPNPTLTPGPAKTLRDFVWLLRAELFVLREEWFWYLLQASFVSLSYLAFLWFLIGPEAPSVMQNLIVGSLVMSLSFSGMLSLGQHLGYLKELQAFDYYASLPISKGAFIAAVTTRGMLLSLPATLFIVILAAVFLKMQFTGLSVLVLLLSAYAMAGFGAVIGFYSPTAQVSSLLTQILQTVIIFFAPVYYPPLGAAGAVAAAGLPLAHHPLGAGPQGVADGEPGLWHPGFDRGAGPVLPGLAGADPFAAGLARAALSAALPT